MKTKIITSTFDCDTFLLHPLRKMDADNIISIENDIFEILSDEDTTKYIPEKRVTTIEQIADRTFGIVIGYQKMISYTYFITEKSLNRVIGLIHINSPEMNKISYNLDSYSWMIEFYLHKEHWKKGIMTKAVIILIQNLYSQGITKIGAACNRENKASLKLLSNIGFVRESKFDILSDYFILDLMHKKKPNIWEIIKNKIFKK